MSLECDKEMGEIERSKTVLWSFYVDHNPFDGKGPSHKLKKIRLINSYIYITHVIYFASVLGVCLSPCDAGISGKEPL